MEPREIQKAAVDLATVIRSARTTGKGIAETIRLIRALRAGGLTRKTLQAYLQPKAVNKLLGIARTGLETTALPKASIDDLLRFTKSKGFKKLMADPAVLQIMKQRGATGLRSAGEGLMTDLPRTLSNAATRFLKSVT